MVLLRGTMEPIRTPKKYPMVLLRGTNMPLLALVLVLLRGTLIVYHVGVDTEERDDPYRHDAAGYEPPRQAAAPSWASLVRGGRPPLRGPRPGARARPTKRLPRSRRLPSFMATSWWTACWRSPRATTKGCGWGRSRHVLIEAGQARPERGSRRRGADHRDRAHDRLSASTRTTRGGVG